MTLNKVFLTLVGYIGYEIMLLALPTVIIQDLQAVIYVTTYYSMI